MQETTLVLKDGRTLAYAEYGDPNGTPVIFFHGNPGSRYMHHPDESRTAALGVRMITPDRPGYGLSDYQPGRTLLDTAADVEAMAGSLGLDTFNVIGVSAGGPHALAAAFALPNRVRRVAVVSGAAPFDREDPLADVSDDYRQAYKVAKWPGWLLRLLMRMQIRSERQNPDKAWAGVLARANDYDREILSDIEVEAQVRGYRTEAVKKGVRGWVQEARLLVRPWGFALKGIGQPVALWYWRDDPLVPPQMGRYIESQLPQAEGHFLSGGGHFAWMPYWDDILRDLCNPEAETHS